METQELEPSPPPPPADGDPISGSRLFTGDLSVADSSNDPSTDTPLDSADALVDLQPVAEGAGGFSGGSFISDDLRDKIVRQVEYYFSDENLPNDKFLLKQLRRDKEGYVPIALISSFRKMKKLTKDLSLIEVALRVSTLLVVSSDGKKVKRLHPLPITKVKDVKPRIVLVENLPEDYSEDNIRRIFESAGHIMEVIICDPHSLERSTHLSKTDLAISSKLHALIEYDTVEAAENAVLALNDEKNWRNGMQVQLLSKRMEKYGIVQKGRKDVSLEKNYGAEKGEEEHINGVKGERSRYKSRGRGYHRQPTNIQGHGYVLFGSAIEGLNKPILGPKMPDGTRGFTMGRGKSITI